MSELGSLEKEIEDTLQCFKTLDLHHNCHEKNIVYRCAEGTSTVCAGTRTLVSAAACPSLMDSEYGIELTENTQDPEEQHIVDGRNSGRITVTGMLNIQDSAYCIVYAHQNNKCCCKMSSCSSTKIRSKTTQVARILSVIIHQSI